MVIRGEVADHFVAGNGVAAFCQGKGDVVLRFLEYEGLAFVNFVMVLCIFGFIFDFRFSFIFGLRSFLIRLVFLFQDEGNVPVFNKLVW